MTTPVRYFLQAMFYLPLMLLIGYFSSAPVFVHQIGRAHV